MARMDIAFDDGVELEHAESVRLGLGEAVKHELFADVHPAAVRTDGIAGVRNVTAAPHVVGMEDVQSQNRSLFVHRNACICLRGKELGSGMWRQRFLLREGIARLDDLVPDGNHAADVVLFVFSDCHLPLVTFQLDGSRSSSPRRLLRAS